MGPSARGPSAREQECVHLILLNHAELEILVEWSARYRTPVTATAFRQFVQGAARAKDPI
jgi:hypothetical protein